jgi:hypothetical protein
MAQKQKNGAVLMSDSRFFNGDDDHITAQGSQRKERAATLGSSARLWDAQLHVTSE